MTGCATFKAGAPEGAIDVIAHRGASAYRPENTLASFEHAIELGADWFELDCMLTRDLEVVVIHDSTLDRTTSGTGRVADHTLSELQPFEAGAWYGPEFAGEPIPTLGQALDLARKRIGVYCEIKNSHDDTALIERILSGTRDVPIRTPEVDAWMIKTIEESLSKNLVLTRRVVRAIRERKMTHQVVIQSFSPIVCAVALIEAPDIRTELLASYDEKRPERWDDYLRWAELLDVPGFNTSNSTLTQPLLESLQGAGRTVAVYTVNDPDDMRRLAEWQVDAIITDKPDVCLTVLREMGKHWKRPWWE
jgi:glycerophosphoryl diester phosphodiesterase